MYLFKLCFSFKLTKLKLNSDKKLSRTYDAISIDNTAVNDLLTQLLVFLTMKDYLHEILSSSLINSIR